MAAALATFDPSQVVIDFLGSLLTQWMSITITPPELYTDEAGVGAVARLRKADRRCDIEIVLLQTAPANQIMSGIVTLDRGGNGVGPLLIKDGSGATVFAALTAWISQEPSVSMNKDSIETYTWKLRCDDYTLVV